MPLPPVARPALPLALSPPSVSEPSPALAPPRLERRPATPATPPASASLSKRSSHNAVRPPHATAALTRVSQREVRPRDERAERAILSGYLRRPQDVNATASARWRTAFYSVTVYRPGRDSIDRPGRLEAARGRSAGKVR